MTVAIEIVSADGVVIAADSRTTLQVTEDAPTRVLSDFTHKVFQAGNMGLATWGWAFLLRRNISGHVAEFVQQEDLGTLDVKGMADRLAGFFGDRLDEHLAQGFDETPPEGVDVLGFFVGGFEEGVGRTYEIRLPSRTVELRHDSALNPGAAWRGQTDVIARLIKGVDWDLVAMFASEDGAEEALSALQPSLEGLEYYIPFHSMTLQDAIDFAVFAIRTTIDTQRLTYGTVRRVGSWPGVGGPIEILAVTATDGLRWVQRTYLQGERRGGEAEQI